ncbi:MAG: hypothetical protein ACK5C4_19015, partial [Pseudanabaena sp.]
LCDFYLYNPTVGFGNTPIILVGAVGDSTHLLGLGLYWLISIHESVVTLLWIENQIQQRF